jgi:hypothetical protein
MELLRENGKSNARFEAYVYVNVNHSDLATCVGGNWGGFALIKKAAGPKALRLFEGLAVLTCKAR